MIIQPPVGFTPIEKRPSGREDASCPEKDRLMLLRTVVSTLVLVLGFVPLAVWAQGDDSWLQRRQQEQQVARRLAEDLVAHVLNQQLDYLEQNGLQDSTIYAEIRQLRSHLAQAAAEEWPRLQALIEAARAAPADQREVLYVPIRTVTRDIASRLIAERMIILKRLQLLSWDNQLRELKRRQESLQVRTVALEELTNVSRTEAVLQTREDQADLQPLLQAFVDSVKQAAEDSSVSNPSVLQLMRVLEQHPLVTPAQEAVNALARGEIHTAQQHQQTVIVTLQHCLDVLSSPAALPRLSSQLSQQLQQLHDEQQDLRAETLRQRNLSDESMVRRQQQLHDQLVRLRQQWPQLGEHEATWRASEQAMQRAFEALFEEQREQALAAQGRAQALLRVLMHELSSASPESHAPQTTARDRFKEAERLQELSVVLHRAEEFLTHASLSPPAEFQPSQKALDQAQALVNQTPTDQVDPALQSALQAAQQATQTAHQQGQQGMTPQAQKATDQAAQAVKHAGQLAASLAERARQSARTLAIGEMVRAAEVLERAAAVERELANNIRHLAQSATSTDDELAALREQQRQMAELLDNVAEGLPLEAEAAHPTLQQAQQQVAASGQQLLQAAPPSKESLAQAASHADQAAQHLQHTAQQLRSAAWQQAQQLAQQHAHEQTRVQQAYGHLLQHVGESPAALALHMGLQAQQHLQQAEHALEHPWSSSANDAPAPAEGIDAALQHLQAAQAITRALWPNSEAAIQQALAAAAQASQAHQQNQPSLAEEHRQTALQRTRQVREQLAPFLEKLSSRVDRHTQQQSAALAEAHAAAPSPRPKVPTPDQPGAAQSPQDVLGQHQHMQQAIEEALALWSRENQLAMNQQNLLQALAKALQEHLATAEQLHALRRQVEQQHKTNSEDEERAGELVKQFAQTQREAGQTVATFTGQRDLADPRLRAALWQAQRLTQGSAAATHASVPSTRPSESGGSAAASPSQDEQNSPTAADVGFVSQQPEQTAHLMAGPQIAAALRENSLTSAAEMSSASPSSPAQVARMSQNASSAPTGAMHQEPAGEGTSTSPSGPASGGKPGSSSEHDTPLTNQSPLHDPPWFAQLPAEIRQALRSGGRQRLPRAHERLLRQYFQTIETPPTPPDRSEFPRR
ncbi:MAG: hypothetical protein KatS3mg113_0266 [Planctomycetaceae bacterium]|nr:MAG: hypothetical protein KatS3mg113_0266 [Planctomycetaceae bacterium]